MSYLRKIQYKIVLKDSFWIIRNCPKCGRKAHYINTKKFRINANGNRLDIWLIYQWVECKHSLNLAIYERKKVSSIPKVEYQCFLDNDEQLAEMYGKNMQLFQAIEWCQANSEVICNKANVLYKKYISNEPFAGRNRCLNFPKLESECKNIIQQKREANSGLSVAIHKRDKLRLLSFLNSHPDTTACTKIRVCQITPTYP